MKEDFVQHLKDYHEFMQWDDEEEPDYANMSQEQAKQTLKEDLEFIIGTNGVGELYETEKMYMKLLDMKEEDY